MHGATIKIIRQAN